MGFASRCRRVPAVYIGSAAGVKVLSFYRTESCAPVLASFILVSAFL